MKIYAVADIHGRQANISLIAEKVNRYKPDLLIVAGDLTGLTGGPTTVSQLNCLNVRVLAVGGNADGKKLKRLFREQRNLNVLHLESADINGVKFLGVGGTVPVPFDSRIGWNEKKILSRLDPLVDEKTILIAHTPPKGVLDRVFGRFHAGSRGLKDLVDRKQPRVVICGHIHESAGFDFLGRTLVVNCSLNRKSGGALIEIGLDNAVRVNILSRQ